MSHTLFPQLVKLNEETHKYFDASGQEYIGFSRFSSLLGLGDFEAKKDMIAYVTAKSQDVDKSVILDKWDQQRDAGTRIDKALEVCVPFKGYIPDEYADIAEIIKSVLKEYESFGDNTYEQLLVHNAHYRVAGAIDKCCFTSSRKDSSFHLSDFKCFDKGVEDLYLARGWFGIPFKHWPKTKYLKIATQLSFYAFQLEELTGKRCSGLWIHLIHPTTGTHQKIPVPYLRNDIIIALETHKEAILEMVTPKDEYIF